MSDPSFQNLTPAEDAGQASTSPTGESEAAPKAPRSPFFWVKFILVIAAIVFFWLLIDEVVYGFFAGLFAFIGWTFGAIGNTVGWIGANGSMAFALLVVVAIAVGVLVLWVKIRNYTLWGPCRNCGTDGNGYRICGNCGRVK